MTDNAKELLALEVKIERLRKNHFAGMEVMRSFALEIIEALSAAPGEPCAVKPLEWCRESPTEWKPETWRADSLAGEYDIQREKDGRFSGFAPNAGTNLFGTLDEAKAAAQADYEQRIKSALVFEGRK